MSLIVAIKDRDRFVFGSDKQVSFGMNKSHDATKIWAVDDMPGAIMGSVGTVRASQIIQYNNIIDLNAVASHGGIDTSFIINSLVPSIYKVLKANGVVVTADGGHDGDNMYYLPNEYLFAFRDKAWRIYSDLTVMEIEDYVAIGSGFDVADGALFATEGKNPFERITTCIAAAERTTLFVDMGIDILTTKTYPQDKKQIRKALGDDMVVEDSVELVIDKDTIVKAIKDELAKEPEKEETPPKKKKPTKKDEEKAD